MDGNVEELLDLNSVDAQAFASELYETLIRATFATLVKEIDTEKAWPEVRDRFHAFQDHVHVTKLLISKYVGSKFRQEDYEYFCRLLEARLRKRDQRRRYPDDFKLALIETQNGRCPICNSAISLDSSELDHVIPWSLVGDELADNLQMLCIRCNRRKSATIDYALLSTFLTKE